MPTIETRRDGKFFYLTLNRTHRKNAFDPETYQLAADLLNQANQDPEIAFTVLTGKDDFFSSGSDFDFKKLQGDGVAWKTSGSYTPPYFHLISQLIEHKKILVALVNGPAIGIGVTMLSLFDLVIASDKAYFTTPFTQLGLAVEGTSSYSFLANFGRLAASRLLLFSEKLTAEQAHQIGLVSHVVPHANFEQSCKKQLDYLGTLAPQSMLQCKARMINESVRKELWHSHVEEKILLGKRWESDEVFEFMAKKFNKKSKI
ncbi:Crotonase domain containing protein [Aphelenchoides bicaudatus]|nr:Crotonase domain containing protein [Aphelenchoides bicaudatus]